MNKIPALYLENIKFLDERTKNLLNKIEPLNTQVVQTKTGQKTLVFKNPSGKEILLHSRYDPIQEAKRFAEKYCKNNLSVVVLLGFGLGYHVREILKTFQEDIKLIVVESSRCIFKAAVENVDLREILSSGKLILSIEEDKDAVMEKFATAINFSNLNKVKLIRHTPSIQVNPEYYNQIAKILKDVIDLKSMNLTTHLSFGKLWQENILKNLHNIIYSKPVKLLFNRFKGLPAIIVASGPSLDKNIRYLKEIEDKALILATDTALKPMHKRGIRPHILVSVDPQPSNYKHIKGIILERTALVADSIACPQIFENVKFFRFVSSFGHPIIKWLEFRLGEFGSLKGGGSVSTVAFDLTRKMGCDPIIFIGQDLSFTGSKFYANGTCLEEEWIEQINKFRTLEMIHNDFIGTNFEKEEGINGCRLKTRQDLVDYKKWLEHEAAQTNALCINATEGGILKDGFEIMSLNEAISLYCKDPIPVESILKNAALSDRLSFDRNGLKEDIRNIIKRSIQFETLCKEATKELTSSRDITRINRLNDFINGSSFARLIEPSIQGVLWEINNLIKKDITYLKILYEELIDASSKLRDLFIKAMDEI
jgi:hypothetical protein